MVRRLGRSRMWGWAVLLVVILGGLAGCSAEDQGEIRDQASQLASDAEREARDAVSEVQQELEDQGDAQTEAQTAPVAPSPTAVAEPTPEATPQPSPEPVVDEPGRNWWPLVLGLLAILVVVALVGAAMSRRRAERARLQAAVRDLLGTGRWVLDQGSLEVMRLTEPSQLDRSWQVVRERLVGMEERVATLLVDIRDTELADTLREVSEVSESLRSVLDGNVALRSDTNPDTGLVADSGDAVRQRRNDFGAALDRLATFR